MGHGCYYTNKETRTKSFWIDLDYTDENGENYDEYLWSDTISNLKYELEEMGWMQESKYKFYNGLFELFLESGHGGEVVFRMEPYENGYSFEDNRIYNLGIANHCKHYESLGRKLFALGYDLRIASSGYTSTTYLPTPKKVLTFTSRGTKDEMQKEAKEKAVKSLGKSASQRYYFKWVKQDGTEMNEMFFSDKKANVMQIICENPTVKEENHKNQLALSINND